MIRDASIRARRTVRSSALGRLIRRTPLWPWMRPRRFHVYCVGGPKTGTTSLARLFKKNYRAAHEPGIDAVVDVIRRMLDGEMDRRAVQRFLHRHDRKHWLELESSHPLSMFCSELVHLFPEARFILTVRDCYSWLDSMINQHVKSFNDPKLPSCWRVMNDIYFGTLGDSFRPEERVLEKLGLYPVEGYLSGWTRHYRRVLEAVPGDRLLVLRTDHLSHEVDRIASFAGVPTASLDLNRKHSHRTRERHHVLDEVDADYLAAMFEKHCGDMMQRLFPEMDREDLGLNV